MNTRTIISIPDKIILSMQFNPLTRELADMVQRITGKNWTDIITDLHQNFSDMPPEEIIMDMKQELNTEVELSTSQLYLKYGYYFLTAILSEYTFEDDQTFNYTFFKASNN